MESFNIIQDRITRSRLAGDPPDALLVTGDGDAALGAALVAVKLGVPTAWLAGEDSGFTTGADFSCNGGLHMG